MLKFSLKILGYRIYVKYMDMKHNILDIVKEIAWVKEQRNRFMGENKQKARQVCLSSKLDTMRYFRSVT